MDTKALTFIQRPTLKGARLVFGLTGWMDGGDVSSGVVDYLVEELEAKELAEIQPDQFYIYSFPGPMEVASLFRPEVRIEDGLVTSYEEPINRFYYAEEQNLILFKGKEPNLGWHEFADCLLAVVDTFQVDFICFVGSVASVLPHTRDPRFHASVSAEHLGRLWEEHGLLAGNYEGPGSFVTYLTTRCAQRDLDMLSLVAEVPAYVQGRNVRCVEAAVRKVAELIDLPVDCGDLHILSAEFGERLSEVVQSRPDLADYVRKMEDAYDREEQDSQMPGLRTWFEKQGIRLD